MKLVASFSIKGGVGKTSTAVNLAYLAAKDGLRTLLVDLDPQAAASFYFRMESRKKWGESLFQPETDWDDLVKASDFQNLHVLPADLSFRKIDSGLKNLSSPKSVVRDKFNSLASDYDLIVLDCHPGLTMLTQALFRICPITLCPVIPTTLSMRTLAQLVYFMKRRPKISTKLVPYFSMAEKRKKMHVQIIRYVFDGKLNQFPPFMKSVIPYMADIEKMGMYRGPLPYVLPQSRGTKVYDRFYQEFKPLLNSGEE